MIFGTQKKCLKMSSNVKITIDGNSIYADYLSTQTMGQVINTILPVKDSGATYNNIAISGQTWEDMNTNVSDVDSSFDALKTNILICSETTNSSNLGGLTSQQIYDAATLYIQNRLTAHSEWIVVLCGSLPRYKTNEINQTMIDADNLMAENYRKMGANAFVNYRNSIPFNHDGSQTSYFSTQQQYWADTSNWTHPNNAGKLIMAQMISLALRRISK